MLDDFLTRFNYLLMGAFATLIGLLGSYIGILFLGMQFFGDAEFEMAVFLIGAFSLVVGPPAMAAGVRLLLNKPNESGGLLSPRMLRVFAVFFAMLGGFSVYLASKENPTGSIFVAVIFAVVTQQAFSLARRRETAHQTMRADTRPGVRTGPQSPSRVSIEGAHPLHESRAPTETSLFEFVYVNEDGTIREVSPRERRYLSEVFEPFDGGRPYIKESLDSLDGWGGMSGFLERRNVPPGTRIEPINPDCDARYEALMASRPQDPLADSEEVGDGSPKASRKVSFEQLKKQNDRRRREEEALARNPDR